MTPPDLQKNDHPLPVVWIQTTTDDLANHLFNLSLSPAMRRPSLCNDTTRINTINELLYTRTGFFKIWHLLPSQTKAGSCVTLKGFVKGKENEQWKFQPSVDVLSSGSPGLATVWWFRTACMSYSDIGIFIGNVIIQRNQPRIVNDNDTLLT